MRPGFCALGALSLLLSVHPLPAAVFRYAGQLPNVLVNVYGNVVEYRIFDPDKGRFVGNREAGATISGLQSKDGIVVWHDGSVVKARFYDRNVGGWRGTQVASATVEQMEIHDGVLTWRNATLVNALVFDLCRSGWRLNQTAVVNPMSRLQSEAGTVAWIANHTVYIRVYNPVRGVWIEGQGTSAANPGDLLNQQGIVAWSSGGVVYLRTYAPELGRFVVAEVDSATPADLQIDTGVVAWKATGRVYLAAYDPMLQLWRPAKLESGDVTGLAIHASTVSYTDPERNSVLRGYSVETGKWFAGMTVPFASFGASSTSNDAPKTVYFYDRSLGASGWGWDFDDGEVRFERATHHTFSDASTYRVSLAVHGPHGMPSGAATDIALAGDAMGTAAGANAGTGNGEEFQRLESSRTAEGLLQVTIHGTPGDEVELQASDNLADWDTIAELSNSTGTLIYVDPDSATMPHRYYRSKVVNP